MAAEVVQNMHPTYQTLGAMCRDDTLKRAPISIFGYSFLLQFPIVALSPNIKLSVVYNVYNLATIVFYFVGIIIELDKSTR